MTPEPALCPRCAERTATFDHCEHCGGDVLLRDRYLLQAEVGHGARGTVYRALDRASGEAVAVKEVPFRKIDELKVLDLADREIQVLRQLKHPSVPRHIDDFVDGPGKHRSLYLVQEFIEGESLADEMAQRRYSERDVLAVLVGVLDALTYLHGLSPQVIHRDVKPGNIIRRPDGRLVLVDFGSARDKFRAVSEGSTVAGTFGYMAPEQFHGDAFAATDIYGLGAVAVALLSRRDPSELLDYQRGLRWEQVVNVSPATRDLLSRMLAADPHQRPSDAARLQAHIKALVHGSAASPSPRPAPQRPGAWSGFNPVAELEVALRDFMKPIDRALTQLGADVSAAGRPPPPPPRAPSYSTAALRVRPTAELAHRQGGFTLAGAGFVLCMLALLSMLMF